MRDRSFAVAIGPPSSRKRVRGLMRLSKQEAPDLLDWCLLLMDDESIDVRVAALKTMLHCKRMDPGSVEPLVRSEDVRVRAASIAALAWNGGRLEPHWLARGLKDPSPCVRVATAALIPHLDRSTYRSLFALALHDPNPSVVRLARRRVA